MKVKLPQLLKDETTYEFIKSGKDRWRFFLRSSLFLTIFFSLFVQLPTVALWMISNQIQIFQMFDYYNVNFPASYSLYSEAFSDFLMLETVDID